MGFSPPPGKPTQWNAASVADYEPAMDMVVTFSDQISSYL